MLEQANLWCGNVFLVVSSSTFVLTFSLYVHYCPKTEYKRNMSAENRLLETGYKIWCGVHTLGNTSAFVNLAGQLLLTRRVNS